MPCRLSTSLMIGIFRASEMVISEDALCSDDVPVIKSNLVLFQGSREAIIYRILHLTVNYTLLFTWRKKLVPFDASYASMIFTLLTLLLQKDLMTLNGSCQISS